MEPSNAEAARRYLTERRTALVQEITRLEGRLVEIDYLLSELATPIRDVAPVIHPATSVRTAAPPVHRPDTRKPESRKKRLYAALVEAGAAGLTVNEASERAGILKGSASSGLSLLKAAGKATHVRPRYYAVVRAPSSANGSRAHRGSITHDVVMAALMAAGDAGTTSKELAAQMGAASATISARLSELKTAGRVEHVSPRYYALEAA